MRRIAVTTECVADLPADMLKERNIDIIYFDIITEGGTFRDTEEIHTMNILEYMAGGEHKAKSTEPSPREFRKFFEQHLVEYDELIHICIGSKVAGSIENASLARAQMGIQGQLVHIVDSGHLSAGQGFIALMAAEMAENGEPVQKILAAIEELKPRISTSFITRSADYLYYNGRASEKVMKMCNLLSVHPVLHMVDGDLVLKGVRFGNYERASARYVMSLLRDSGDIDTRMGFLIHSGCNVDFLNRIKEWVDRAVHFDQLPVNNCSATVSCNCGPDAFGILFIRK